MKTIFSLIFTILSFVVFANDYTPLVREGVKWHCRMDVVSLITETESYPYTIEIKGDTVINNISYKKCYYTFEDESVATNEIPRAFLREDIGEKKVYALYNYDYKTTLPHYSLYGHFEPFTEGLLYDFNNLANANQGWYAFVNNGEEDTITTEVVELNSKEYVKTTLNTYFVFIEGIGIVENKYFEHEGDLLNPAMSRISSAFSPEALPIFCSFEDETGKVIYTSEMTSEENDYTPLVREGVKWDCSMSVIYGPSIEGEVFKYTIEFKGDTIINEKTYKRCYYTFETNSIATNDIPRAFLREDVGEKKVYVLLNDDYKINVPYTPPTYDTDSGEKLLYDFNNWENTELCWNTSSIINSIVTKTINYKGKDYKKTILNDEYVVVEGIGFAHNENTWCGYDLLHPFIDGPKEDTPFVGSMSLLNWFIDENGTAIDMSDFMAGVEDLKQDSSSISIEIVNGNINVCSTDKIKSVRIINMAGVQVDVISAGGNAIVIPTDYPSGCYIIQVATENNIATKKIIL